MKKTNEELNAIKEEFEALREKLTELTDEQLEQVIGGTSTDSKQERPVPEFIYLD